MASYSTRIIAGSVVRGEGLTHWSSAARALAKVWLNAGPRCRMVATCALRIGLMRRAVLRVRAASARTTCRLMQASTADYLREFRWGLAYLDSGSWRHYLPHLLAHAAKHHARGSDVTDALIQNLRPPDRGQLSSLSSDQKRVVIKVLELIAFCDASPHSHAAQTALEEWYPDR